MSDGGRLGVGKLRAQIGERAEGRQRNQLGYFPGFICYLPALARIVLWPGVTGTCDSEQRLKGQERYLCGTYLVLLAFRTLSFTYSINKQFVEALLCSRHCPFWDSKGASVLTRASEVNR